MTKEWPPALGQGSAQRGDGEEAALPQLSECCGMAGVPGPRGSVGCRALCRNVLQLMPCDSLTRPPGTARADMSSPELSLRLPHHGVCCKQAAEGNALPCCVRREKGSGFICTSSDDQARVTWHWDVSFREMELAGSRAASRGALTSP